jgi:hypothetical protein
MLFDIPPIHSFIMALSSTGAGQFYAVDWHSAIHADADPGSLLFWN